MALRCPFTNPATGATYPEAYHRVESVEVGRSPDGPYAHVRVNVYADAARARRPVDPDAPPPVTVFAMDFGAYDFPARSKRSLEFLPTRDGKGHVLEHVEEVESARPVFTERFGAIRRGQDARPNAYALLKSRPEYAGAEDV